MKKRKNNPNALKDFFDASEEAGTTSGITIENFDSKLSYYLNHCQRNFDLKDSRKFIIEARPEIEKNVNALFDKDFNDFKTLGFAFKFLKENGLSEDFHAPNKKWISAKIEELISLKKEKKEVSDKPKHNIQQVIREQIREKIGELDAYFDDYVQGIKNNLDVIAYIKSTGLSPLHIRKIYNIYKLQWQEFVDADEDFKEYYSFLSEEDFKNIIAFYETNLEKVDSYIKANSTRRAKTSTKRLSVKKLISKVQYLKSDETLGITSLSPDKIMGATMVLLYNVKYKKISLLRADTVSGFSIKGTSIHNYRETNSFCKSVKNDTDFSLFMGTKTMAVTNFDSLEKPASPANGRLGIDTLILSIYK
jgi:hypothetical protein